MKTNLDLADPEVRNLLLASGLQDPILDSSFNLIDKSLI